LRGGACSQLQLKTVDILLGDNVFAHQKVEKRFVAVLCQCRRRGYEQSDKCSEAGLGGLSMHGLE
jgi:hypothetical protein